MNRASITTFGLISVVFEQRDDGGLSIYSDDVPGFILSHPDRDLILKDVKPAIETILSEMLGEPVTVEPVDHAQSLPWFPPNSRQTRNYQALRAA